MIVTLHALRRGAIAAALLGIPGLAHATAGYGVGQDSVVSAGLAHAGGAAAAGDASTVWYNPAGMTRFNDPRHRFYVVMGGVLILPTIEYNERGSVLADGVTRLTGDEANDVGQRAVVPHAYLVWNYSDSIKFGVGLNAPWGLATEYNETWLGRYSETRTDLKTVNINPSASWRVTDQLSIGGGLNGQYAHVKVVQRIDFGSVCVAALGLGPCAGLGLAPQGADGRGAVVGDDFGWGYNLGALFELTPRTRFGAQYRSTVEYKAEGDARFVVPAAALAILGPTQFRDTSMSAKFTTPQTASVSAYHEITDRWAIMGDVTWTDWTVFQEFRARFANATPDSVLITKWNSAFRYALGTSYRWTDAITVRAGVAYDESPISDAFRGPGIPDSDRTVIGLGASFEIRPGLILDLAYQHLFFDEGAARRLNATNSVLIGEFNVDAHVVGLGIRWQF